MEDVVKMINVKIHSQQEQKLSPKITVVGVGGAGCNAVNNMIATKLEGVDFVGCNSDAQSLEGCLAETKIQLGANITGGLGAGAKPEIGRAAAEETIDEVISHFDNTNMVFVTAGMGGGTGTGAAPVIARAAREKGILTVGVVTKPFHFEGAHRMRSAEAGIEELQQYVDTLIVIPNQNLFRVANEKTTFAEAFKMADTVLQSGVRGVTDLMVMPGLINLDFADVRAIMLEMGKAMMGTGEAEGERRAVEAAEKAINNPLLDDVSMKGAQGVIINITGGYDLTLFEVDEACNRIRDEVDPDANIIFGSTFDESLEGKVRVSIVATGIDAEAMQKTKPPKGFVYTSANKNTTYGRVTPRTQETPSYGAATATSAPATAPVIPTVAAPQPSTAQTQTAKVETATSATTGESVPTGLRYGSSYIPPKPVETTKPTSYSAVQGITYPVRTEEAQPAVNEAPSYETAQSYEQEQTVQEDFLEVKATGTDDYTFVPEQQTATASAAGSTGYAPASAGATGLVLNPPKAPQAKKRPPSLFERFTGHWKDEAEETTSTGVATTTDAPSGGTLPSFAELRAQKPETQGSLGIDTPAAAAKPAKSGSDDDLDIPAFLRRQAN